MRQLSDVDARLLRAESPSSAGHVGVLVLADPPAGDGSWGLGDVRAVLEPRLHLAPALRRRLVEAPLGLGPPALGDDPHFDLELHLHEVALRAPGSREQLAEEVARLQTRPLDRARPPWELTVLTGLEDGRVALHAKTHPVLVGDGGLDVLDLLLEPGPEPRQVEEEAESAPTPLPSALDLAAREIGGLLRDPVVAARALPSAVARLEAVSGLAALPGLRVATGVAGTVGRFLTGAASAGPREPVVPWTRLSGPATAHRRLAFASLPLEDVGRVADRAATTVDAVLLATVAGALRRWLLDRDALPTVPLVASVPVVLPDPVDGTVAVARVPLPTHVRGARERLEALREAVAVAADHLEAVPGPSAEPPVPTLSGLVGLETRAVLGGARGPGPTSNLVVGHVDGPAAPRYVAGARVVGVHPVHAVSATAGGLAVGSLAYDGGLHLGLVACRELVPDVGTLRSHVEGELGELLTAG